MAKQKRDKDVSDEAILVASKQAKNAGDAAKLSGLTHNAYKYRALKLGCYNPTRIGSGAKVPLEEILQGKHPNYQTFKLRNRLIKEGLKKNACEMPDCGVDETWLGKKISCQLDHIDGDRFNHRWNNLRMICPNCHSQTETFSGKNK